MKKSLLIMVACVILVGILYVLVNEKPINYPVSDQPIKSFSSEIECKKETGKECDFKMCDYIPEGKTIEEVCGKNFKKGWYPIN